jgi:hypothetical protein
LVTMEKGANGEMQTNEQSYSIFDEGIYRLPSVAGKYGNISFLLNNNLEMKVKNPSDTTGQLKKIKLLESLNVSTSYDIFRDSLNLSPIQLTARTMILDQFNLSFRSDFNAYAYDSIVRYGRSTYQTINTFEVMKTGKLLRLTSANFSLGFSLPLKSKQKKETGTKDQTKAKQTTGDSDEMPEFSGKWSLRVDYNFLYNKPYKTSTITQSLRVSGDLALTPKWNLTYSSGYDFVNKKITYTTIGIMRDLHCWMMSINIVPFGQYKSYTFSISAKGSLLKDIKYQKIKDWRDQ